MVEGQERLQNTRSSLVLSPNSLPILPRLGQGCAELSFPHFVCFSGLFLCEWGRCYLTSARPLILIFFFFRKEKVREA